MVARRLKELSETLKGEKEDNGGSKKSTKNNNGGTNGKGR